MLDPRKLLTELPHRNIRWVDLDSEPTKEELRDLVSDLKAQGLCGRRIAEEYLGPYFIAHNSFGQSDIERLDEVIDEVYADTEFCTRTRQSECSRLRGGCKGSR